MNLPSEQESHPQLELTQPLVGDDKTILTTAALAFLAELAAPFHTGINGFADGA